MKDTELQAVDIVEYDEGSAEEEEVLAAVDQPDQAVSVAVGSPVVPAQVESGIVLLAGWESEKHVQSAERSVVQTVEESVQLVVESDVQLVGESGVQTVEESGVQFAEESGVQSVGESEDQTAE